MAQIIAVPALGGVSSLEVVELLVKAGDSVEKDQPVAVLESDKSSLEIVADKSGVVSRWIVAIGASVSPGSALLEIDGAVATTTTAADDYKAPSEQPVGVAPVLTQKATLPEESPSLHLKKDGDIYASPAVRQMARHLEIPLAQVQATGDRGRITIADLKRYVHQSKATSAVGQANADPKELPDSAYWGSITPEPMSKIKRITATRLLQQWQQIPHVTQFNEAVINDLQSFREEHKEHLLAEGVKLTLLPFIIQALCRSLKKHPEFNAVLSANGAELLQLSSINVGIAVETPEGLVVPVLKGAAGQNLKEIASNIQNLAQKARLKQLHPTDMQGHTFTISSLGAYGGTAFTPIIHAPNVAILGISRSRKRYGPGGAAEEVLPLSLSYDHRVIDGAQGARFLQEIVDGLEDLRL